MTQQQYSPDNEECVVIPRRYITMLMNNLLHYDDQEINSTNAVYQLLERIGFMEKQKSEFHAIYLDYRNRVIGMELIKPGITSMQELSLLKLLRGAVLANAHGLILVNLRPESGIYPLNEDSQIMKSLILAAEQLRIRLLDYIIIGKNKARYSYRSSAVPE